MKRFEEFFWLIILGTLAILIFFTQNYLPTADEGDLFGLFLRSSNLSIPPSQISCSVPVLISQDTSSIEGSNYSIWEYIPFTYDIYNNVAVWVNNTRNTIFKRAAGPDNIFATSDDIIETIHSLPGSFGINFGIRSISIYDDVVAWVERLNSVTVKVQMCTLSGNCVNNQPKTLIFDSSTLSGIVPDPFNLPTAYVSVGDGHVLYSVGIPISTEGRYDVYAYSLGAGQSNFLGGAVFPAWIFKKLAVFKQEIVGDAQYISLRNLDTNLGIAFWSTFSLGSFAAFKNGIINILYDAEFLPGAMTLNKFNISDTTFSSAPTITNVSPTSVVLGGYFLSSSSKNPGPATKFISYSYYPQTPSGNLSPPAWRIKAPENNLDIDLNPAFNFSKFGRSNEMLMKSVNFGYLYYANCAVI